MPTRLFLVLFAITHGLNASTEIDAIVGMKQIEKLQSNSVATTTSCRRELKSVVSQKEWRDIKESVEKLGNFKLDSRDIQPEGGKNSTFTFYGEGVKFSNGVSDVHMRMRARFYLQMFPDKTLRSSQTSKLGWLEIKTRNPEVDKDMGVFKYRILVPDTLLLSLFKAEEENLPRVLEEIRKVASENPQNRILEVKAMTEVLQTVFDLEPNFIRPGYAVSYERSAFKYVEDSYPATKKRVEYQITVDDDVKYHKLVHSDKEDLNIEKYYDTKQSFLGHYPKKLMAIEFKDPFPEANLEEEERSDIHNLFLNDLVKPMQEDIKNHLPFSVNHGKAYHLKRVSGL